MEPQTPYLIAFWEHERVMARTALAEAVEAAGLDTHDVDVALGNPAVRDRLRTLSPPEIFCHHHIREVLKEHNAIYAALDRAAVRRCPCWRELVMLGYKRAIVTFLIAARNENWEKPACRFFHDVYEEVFVDGAMREVDHLFPASGLAAAIDDCVGQVNPHQYNIRE